MADGDRKGLRTRVLEVLGVADRVERGVATSSAPMAPQRPGREVERFLAHELRLPLAAMARLGARMAAGGDAQSLAAFGRALARECQRLDVLVTNALELGLVNESTTPDGHAVLAEVVEKAVAGQRVWIEAHQIRLRVLDGSQDCTVRGDRDALIACLFALLGELLERVPAGGQMELRVRDVHGVARIDVRAPAAIGPRSASEAFTRARALLGRLGGECWQGAEAEGGFGLALPRTEGAIALAVRRNRTSPAPV